MHNFVHRFLIKVISGGQTGVDRAALRAALSKGLKVGGWCPPNRDSEDGAIPSGFPLTETPCEHSSLAPHIPRSQRTEWNVRDSDATLVLKPVMNYGRGDSGTDWAIKAASIYHRPILICDLDSQQSGKKIIDWIITEKIAILHIAGPSERSAPGVGEQTYQLLDKVFNACV